MKLKLQAGNEIVNTPTSHAIKMADGTLICYGNINIDGIIIDTEWNGMYYKYINTNMLFPIKFIASPHITLATNSTYIVQVSPLAMSQEQLESIFVVCNEKIELNPYTWVNYIAIGRWK